MSEEKKDQTALIIKYVLQGLGLIPLAIAAVKSLFGKDTTPEQKASAISNVADYGLQAIAEDSAGPQAEALNKVKEVLPEFHIITNSLMNIAQSTDVPGSTKADFASEAITAILDGYQKMVTGGAESTANQVVPVVKEAVTALKPIMFPKVEEVTKLSGE